MQVNTAVVVWRDKIYWLDEHKVLTVKLPDGEYGIYNFKYCRPEEGCEDDNIVRHAGCNTPVTF